MQELVLALLYVIFIILGDTYSILSFTDFFKENGGGEGEIKKNKNQFMICTSFVGYNGRSHTISGVKYELF